MKYIIVNPIYELPIAPLPGIPMILGILESLNIDVEFIDVNAKFYSELFSNNEKDKITSYYEYISKNMNSSNNDKISQIVIDTIKQNQKYFKITKKIKMIYDFYNFALYTYINYVFYLLLNFNDKIATNITDFLTPDIETNRSNLEETNFSISFKDLIIHFESKFGIYKEFLEAECDKIISQNPDIISVSINRFSSFIFGLYMCYILKSKSNIHINIGGTYFNDFYKNINNLEEMFKYFCDSVSIGDNTQTTVDIVKYIKKWMCKS